MNPHNTLEELKSDLTRIRAKAVIVAHDTSQERIDGLAAAGLLVLRAVSLGGSVHFRLEAANDHTAHFASSNHFQPAEPSSNSDHALVLFTSGTSGTKKIVPYTLDTIVIGAVCVAASWCLSPEDVNLNMMPLYHVGGIVRNLLAPVLAGGSTMLCRGFDASLFVDLLETPPPSQPTWYYAAPTMHHAILQQYALRSPRPRHTLRMICNAAGGLLPSLAIQLRGSFNGAVVLPSYGMTECMPISAPPITYALDRPGTSGRAGKREVEKNHDRRIMNFVLQLVLRWRSWMTTGKWFRLAPTET
jgi:acyl-CoA synthetase (AMP-forming)/AMP-acid ligase II